MSSTRTKPDARRAAAPPAALLERVLRVLRPLARLLVRHGVGYPAFAAALKRVFIDAAHAELDARGMPRTDSAVTLLCGVHRRDVRTLMRAPVARAAARAKSGGIAGEVVARWISDRAFVDRRGAARALQRGAEDAAGSFDALVAGISRDVRPRAVLDELQRLGVVTVDASGRIRLAAQGFAPRGDFDQMAQLFADNLHDHAAAAAANLCGDANFLEQSVYVDRIGAASAEQLQRIAVQAWKRAFKPVLLQAQQCFDADSAAGEVHRARFGVYFFSEREDRS